MASYDDIYVLRYESQWLSRRTEVSVVRVANYMLLEDSNTPDHDVRLTWARWALRGPAGAAFLFMWPMALEPQVQNAKEEVADATIDAVVAAALPGVLADFVANPPPNVQI